MVGSRTTHLVAVTVTSTKLITPFAAQAARRRFRSHALWPRLSSTTITMMKAKKAKPFPSAKTS